LSIYLILDETTEGLEHVRETLWVCKIFREFTRHCQQKNLKIHEGEDSTMTPVKDSI